MSRRYIIDIDINTLPTDSYDFVIVGSGVAGMWCGVDVCTRGKTAIVTKDRLEEGSTLYSQGGIAVALCPQDSPADHLEDTLFAGAGLCSRTAASVLVTEGPRRVKELVSLGAKFDSDEHGELLLAREGSHGVRRIVRAQGDATGFEIQRALTSCVRSRRIDVYENTFSVDLLTNGRHCIGVIVQDLVTGELRVLRSKATILCTGGLGQIFQVTTNPAVVTGDGMAMAFRAGARLMDMEFVQFHPTALAAPRSPKFLISEAARGEGALLRNLNGERFMPRYHEMAELAPRDIVSRAIVAEMRRLKTDHVWLDLTAHERDKIQKRFPCIYRICIEEGIEPSTQPIPVSPAAHYMMGGIRTDLNGETNIAGLFACGECACAGVHGANRLASNSLLEGLVFGSRTIAHAARFAKRQNEIPPPESTSCTKDVSGSSAQIPEGAAREMLREIMWERVGIMRNARGLGEAGRALEELDRMLGIVEPKHREMELANMATLSRLIAQAAKIREESRGAHAREDFPSRDDRNWMKHIVFGFAPGEPLAVIDVEAHQD